jgi:hypothetical protein
VFTVGRRVTLKPSEFKGLTCDVDSIDSQPVQFLVLGRVDAFATAEGAEAILALEELYDTFETLARPVWNVSGPKGVIPSTKAGMLTVPVPLMLTLVALWTETFDA